IYLLVRRRRNRGSWKLLAAPCLVAPQPAQRRRAQNRNDARTIEAGKVSTQAIKRLRTVDHCRPEWFAAMVPATPDESTCVVLTGSPRASAAPIVAIAVISAAAPWA